MDMMSDAAPGPRPRPRLLSRTQMEAAIAEGGSVLHKGQVISHKDHLPSDADLAAGDPERERDVIHAMRQQIRAQQDLLDDLTARHRDRERAEEAARQRAEDERAAADAGTGTPDAPKAGPAPQTRDAGPATPAPHDAAAAKAKADADAKARK
jgi:hypothetical protein